MMAPPANRRAGLTPMMSAYMTDNERADLIRALLEERAGYVKRGDVSHIDAVDEQLRRLGHAASPPVLRAERRRFK